MVARHLPPKAYADQWDVEGLDERVRGILGLELPIADWAAEEKALGDGAFDYCKFGGFRSSKAKATGFFRVEKSYASSPAAGVSLNDAKVQGYYGTSSYYSFNPLDYIGFLGALGVIDPTDPAQTNWTPGLKNRFVLQTFALAIGDDDLEGRAVELTADLVAERVRVAFEEPDHGRPKLSRARSMPAARSR